MYCLLEEGFKSIIKEILNNLGDTKSLKLYVYGSRVKGTAREFSDIDLYDKYRDEVYSHMVEVYSN